MKQSKVAQFLMVCLYFIVTSQLQAASNQSNQQSNKTDAWLQGDEESKWVYSTNGVHSNYGCDEDNNYCIAPRSELAPKDPQFPEQWISDWTMFTVLNEAAASVNPPPYSNPPSTLQPDDYLVSYGTSYYDNNYKPDNPTDDQDYGAMLEYYSEFCLPIFGKTLEGNRITCAFASLGKKAYFLQFPHHMSKELSSPECCQFSPENHPPRIDFLKHLDEWPQANLKLNGSIQAYYWKQLWQPDAVPRILFAYAFNKEKSYQGQLPHLGQTYQHPQSFFFSGLTNLGDKENPNMISPMVSQNYTSFRSEKPSPKLWRQVAQWCPAKTIKKCHLFPGQ